MCKQYQHINDSDSLEVREQKNFYNSILADKKPYFFKYKYSFLNKEYNEYIKKTNENSLMRFSMSLDELIAKQKSGAELTNDEATFLLYYNKFLPVIDSDCVMNKICKYIESIDFKIKQKIKSSHDFDYKSLMTPNFAINQKLYLRIKEEIETTFKNWDDISKNNISKNLERNSTHENTAKKFDREAEYALLKMRLEEICSNEEQLANHLVYLFYEDRASLGKATLWNLVGKQIFENIKNQNEHFYFPIRNENGSLEFLYEKYSIERIAIKKQEAEENTEWVANSDVGTPDVNTIEGDALID